MVDITSHVARLRGLFEGSRLRARSLRATVLVTGGFGLGRVVHLASNLILTRILYPEAFGLMSLVSVFIAGIGMLSDVGLQPSIIRSTRGGDPVFLSTAWTVKVVRGFWITAIAWILAWPYSLIYDEPLLFQLICVSALGAAASGFASIELAVRAREMILGRAVALQLVGQSLAVGLTILFAWWTQSVWGLAIGNAVGATVQTALSHVLLPSRHHRFTWDREVVSEIMIFGRWILLGTLFTYLGGRGIQMIRGTLVDLDTLGFIQIAGMMAWSIGDFLSMLLGRIGFPALSEIVRTRPAELRRMAGRIHRFQTIVSTPVFLGLALVSQPLIDLLYDDRYAPAGIFLGLAALNSAVGVMPMVYQNAMLAIGNSRAHAMIMGLGAGLKIVGAVVGFHLGGAVGMILGTGVGGIVVLGFALAVSARHGFASFRLDMINLAVIVAGYAAVLSGLTF